MTGDDMYLRAKLDQVEAPEPDVSSIVRRGHQIRRSRRVVAIIGAAATALVVAVGAATAVSVLRDSDPRGLPPISEDGDRTDGHVAVYLRDDATDAQVQDILDAVSVMEGVVSVEYISKEQAFAEFKEHYRDEPQLWGNLPPDALPASIRIALTGDADAEAIRAELLVYPGVDAIAARSR